MLTVNGTNKIKRDKVLQSSLIFLSRNPMGKEHVLARIMFVFILITIFTKNIVIE